MKIRQITGRIIRWIINPGRCMLVLVFVMAGMVAMSGSLLSSGHALAYTEAEKQAAKSWLSAHGYSPDRAGASQAYEDYLNGKFNSPPPGSKPANPSQTPNSSSTQKPKERKDKVESENKSENKSQNKSENSMQTSKNSTENPEDAGTAGADGTRGKESPATSAVTSKTAVDKPESNTVNNTVNNTEQQAIKENSGDYIHVLMIGLAVLAGVIIGAVVILWKTQKND